MKKLINLFNKILFKIRAKKKEPKTMERILIVSNTALGDTILSTPVIKTLKKNFPAVHITLMVNKNVYPLFKDYEYVNEVIIYNKHFIGILKHIYFIKKNKIDSIFFLHSNGPQDLFIALLSHVHNIHKAINYPHPISPEFMSIIQNNVFPMKYQHIIEHRLNTIDYLRPSIIDKTIDLPRKFYQQERNSDSTFLLGIQLGAADIYKMWPIENFSILCNKLLDSDTTIKIVLLGIKNEQSLAHQLSELSNDKNRIIDYCGKTRIEELPCILNTLNLLLTNDTGTLHLAIALHKSTVSLFSPTDSKIFGPYQDQKIHTIIQKDGSFINRFTTKQRNQDAMKLITIEEVYNALSQQINRIKTCVE